MTNTEYVRDIFSILHDGTIVEWTGNKDFLTLKIGCQYLAEKLDPTFEYFFIDLIDISKLALVPWMNPITLEQEYFVELKDVLQAELDILSAEIDNDSVKISCTQRDSNFHFCGGALYINCKGSKVYDQNKNEVAIDKLHQICNEYWDEFGRQ